MYETFYFQDSPSTQRQKGTAVHIGRDSRQAWCRLQGAQELYQQE
jgi:hypothetical protein